MLRILTANLYNGGADADAFRQILHTTRPEVVAAQELAPAAAAAIAERHPHGLLLPATDHTGKALVATVPIEVSLRPLPHRDALCGRLVHAGRRLMIWSVHLANPIDRAAFGRRAAQVRALKAAVEGSASDADGVVVVGDLNATPLWPAYRRLLGTLSDGVAEWAEGSGGRAERTWAPRSGARPLLRIDHALTRGVAVVNAETVFVPGSDHRALVVDLG